MNGSRRQWLMRTATGLLLLHQGTAWAIPSAALSTSAALRDALAKLTGGQPLQASNGVVITAQDAVESRRLYPVAVSSQIAHTDMISLLVEDRVPPLVARFDFGPNAEAHAYFYLRMRESTVLHVVAKSGNQYFTATKFVTVPDTTPCG